MYVVSTRLWRFALSIQSQKYKSEIPVLSCEAALFRLCECVVHVHRSILSLRNMWNFRMKSKVDRQTEEFIFKNNILLCERSRKRTIDV